MHKSEFKYEKMHFMTNMARFNNFIYKLVLKVFVQNIENRQTVA